MTTRSTIPMRNIVLAAFGAAAAVTVVAVAMDLVGFPISGAAIGGAVGGLVGVLMVAGGVDKHCPRCAVALPQFRAPRSLKQAFYGGWSCSNCGCEVDRSGKEISRDSATRV
jgi:hypothetical protein